MRILFDNTVYEMRNAGCNAILEAAVGRVHHLWPTASLEVIAEPLARLYIPNSRPVSPYNHANRGWADIWQKTDRVYSLIPKPALKQWLELREEARYIKHALKFGERKRQLQAPRPGRDPAQHGVALQNSAHEADTDHFRDIFKTDLFNGVDLFVAAGGHYMADSVKHLATIALDRLELAIQRGIPTVMVGQGLGPLTDPVLVTRAKAILPRVDLILIREKVSAPKLLVSLGVAPDRIILTGDDAVEMAYAARPKSLGQAIGVGMRVAHYTEIEEKHLVAIRAALAQASDHLKANMVSVAISSSGYESQLDDQAIQQISSGRLVKSHGLHVFDSPIELIRRVGRCRLMVTGAFHPAVFALAQGISTVCVAKSAMYATKFTGLADLYGPGCQVIYLDEPHVQEKLLTAIESAWQSAVQMRPQLLEAAGRQIEWGHAGYQRIYDTVSAKSHRPALSAVH